MTVRLALVGPGAFGRRHLDVLARIDEAEVVAIAGPPLDVTRELARLHGIGHAAAGLDDVLARGDLDAVVLATPTPLHAEQALACLDAGTHVAVEIPLCDRHAPRQAGAR
ncbi:MAG: Gfo/Idh/MocA family oxidoreductase, partial [Actinomycetota bacterium]|nr:Gfo/Idh/MocA family oxidoreductase [Actinomycetota bacterium]